MFVGHYGAAFALKAAVPKAPLWALMAGVQVMDYAWAGLVLVGVEGGRVEPGFLEGSPLVLDHMPYSHSLVGAAAISAAFAAPVAALARAGPGTLAVFAAVFLAGLSHWFTDLIVHAPDLTLMGDPPKYGLGLWAWKWPSLALEAALYGGGLWLLAARTRAGGAPGALAPWVVLGAGGLLAAYNALAPAPASLAEVAASALAAYTVFAALGLWFDRTRAPKG